MIYNILISLVLILPAYTDFLPHTALDKVPAALGATVQIRCSKIIQSYHDEEKYYKHHKLRCNRDHYDEYNEYAHTCNYTWKRDGKVLSDADTNYDIKSFLTFDYCEILEGTSDIVKEMNISTEYRELNYDHNRNRLKCFSSVLTIHEVHEDDFGDYECSVGSSKSWNDNYGALNITVFKFDAASKKKLPKIITYFEKALNRGLKSKVLMQCVVEGGSASVYWFVRNNTSDLNSTVQRIENIESDAWRCFNHSERSHKVANITESFIFFENVCLFDEYVIYCSADSEGRVLSKGRQLLTESSNYDIYYFYNYQFDDALNANLGIVIPTLVILFFSLASVLACCRGGLCHCCGCSSEGLCPCCGETAPRYSQIPNIGYTTAGNAVYPVPSQAYNALPSTVSAPTAASLPPRYVPPNEIPA